MEGQPLLSVCRHFPISLVPLREASQNKYGQSFQRLFVMLFDSIRTKSFCLLIYSCLFVSEIVSATVSIVHPIILINKAASHVTPCSWWCIHSPLTSTLVSLTKISLRLMRGGARHRRVRFAGNVRSSLRERPARGPLRQNCRIHVRMEEDENAQRCNKSFIYCWGKNAWMMK